MRQLEYTNSVFGFDRIAWSNYSRGAKYLIITIISTEITDTFQIVPQDGIWLKMT